MKTIGFTMAASALACACAAPAFAAPTRASAQAAEPDVSRAPIGAPRRAFEIGVNLGYTQGFGRIAGDRPVSALAGPAIGGGLDLAYRVSPMFSIGATGTGDVFQANGALPKGTKVLGATAGVEATLHGRPYDKIDPWVSVGSGYRLLWTIPTRSAATTLNHGFEIAKLQVGLDLRASDNVSISPMIGADINMFNWRAVGQAQSVELSDKRLNTFVFAGVKGRFDIGGARERRVDRIGGR